MGLPVHGMMGSQMGAAGVAMGLNEFVMLDGKWVRLG